MFRDDIDERAFNSGRNQKVIHSNRQPKQAAQAQVASSRIEIDEMDLQNNGSNELNLSSTPNNPSNEVEKLKERILYLEQDQMVKQYQQEERDEKFKHRQIVLNQDHKTIK